MSYYGSGVAESIGRLADITCPVLYHFGGKDDFIPPEQVQTVVDAVEASGRDDLRVDVHAAAGHAFDNHEAPMFHDVDAAAAAWATTVTFLAEHLDRGGLQLSRRAPSRSPWRCASRRGGRDRSRRSGRRPRR